MTPQPVTIVRPPMSFGRAAALTLGVLVALLLHALIVWWLVGTFIWPDYPLGYWQTYAALVALHYVTGSHVSYLSWTSTHPGRQQ